MSEQRPHWQPITMLPVFIEMIDGMLQTSVQQLSLLQLVYEKNHVLSNTCLLNIIEQYTEQLSDHWLYQEQFSRWQRGDLRPAEERAVERLKTQIAKLKESNEAIIESAFSLELKALDERNNLDEFQRQHAQYSAKQNRQGHRGEEPT